MNIYIRVYAALICVCAVASQNWFKILDPAENMKAFFENQRSRMEKAISSSLEGASKMKDYMGEQHKKVSDGINNYVDNVNEKRRTVADSWSFLPTEGTDSRMENPDIALTVPAIISRHGYVCETHTVVSQGYMLNIHRIPRSKTGVNVSTKSVLLQHGLFASSADWILNGPDKGLAYILADAGYDVWMSNIRGNKYSREHAWLKTDSKSYWNFSWHDVALHDIPAVIDYIIKMKGESTKLTYIGHSMGTTIMFAMLTLRPEYNDILSAGFALAPVVYMSDLKSPIKSLAPLASGVAHMEMLYGSYEFIPKNSYLGSISNSCEANSRDATVCKNIIFSICGYNEQQFNKEALPVFLTHLGTGTSWKTAVHFAQEIINYGKFQQFDYGVVNNRKTYGTANPPEYDLSKITLPITLFWAQNDLLSSEKDVRRLFDKLPSTTEMYMVPDAKFNHLDYLWAVDANSLLNEKVLVLLRKVNSTDKGHFMFDIEFGK